jgi:hypothetical protein
MGCGPSKNSLETVDDSVHVMLAHDKKVAAKKGQSTATGYKPRAEHPLLAGGGAETGAAAAATTNTTTTSTSTADGTSNENAQASAASSS